MAYDNDMSGALFRVEEKLSDSHPDYTGSVEINGVKWSVSGWDNIVKSGPKEGQHYIKLRLKGWNQGKRLDAQEQKPAQPAPETYAEDDIPF